MINKQNKKIVYSPKYHRQDQQDINLGKNLYQRFRYGLIKRHFYYLTSSFRTLPNFFVIGGVRCGTTSLYHYLGQHNCIKQAMYDELGYFDDNFHLGLNWYRSLFPTKFIQKKIESKYKKFLTYDVTPFYIYNPLVVDRIFKFSPNAKIIAVLRNPIDRAYSNFNNRIQDEGDTETTFEEIVYSEIEKIKNNENNNENNVFLVNEFYDLDLARGFYAKQLKFWFKKFPRKNIFLTSSEELATNTDKTVSEIFEFLEVPEQKISDLTKQNKIKYPKMKDSTREILINFFKPYNEELFGMIGSKFDWDK
tara:strand:+ start:498 stop:1418 length:921 start_codon:yes stop_codon:yes gene_type:complete